MARLSLLAGLLAVGIIVLQSACGGQVDQASSGIAKVSSVSTGCFTSGQCWLTSGGTKFNTALAKHGPQVSFGGNVYPGCSPDAGDGGQWNHVDHAAGLHFMGTSITVTACGNVDYDPIPPGSTSPVTSYNFIEFEGTGWLEGISGNKQPRIQVCFNARAEDRSEPGSRGQTDDMYKDRYRIWVWDCIHPATALLYLEDSTNPVLTVAVTTGNLQLHQSSCP
jgi:hypothetical protein